ncbi:MAG TPA: hypothetical protein VJT09_09760 [Pyrinomonadaceae bacterium]|nr:hypothetical protein [Pyrinomonadaceae bacterium]
MDKRRARPLLASMTTTFAVIRLYLYFSPDSDFDVAGYNIHHLFTGLLLITFCGIAVILFGGRTRILDAAVVGFGVGLSLALDEWVYLITTDGSNVSYLLPISFWGGVVMLALACLYIAVLYLFNRRSKRPGREPED